VKKIIMQVADMAEYFSRLDDGMALAVTGSGGGLQETDGVLEALETAFLTNGHPRHLTLIHALGIGDRELRGINRLAHEGMVKRVIGGHWTWSPRMLEMAHDNKIEAYCLPGGAIVNLLRETGAGRPGLITKVGLGTFVDPRHGGGRSNARTTQEIVEVMEIEGEEYLRYKPLRVDMGIIRGTFADEDGNISCLEEPADLDIYHVALAAHNCGGRIVAQVRELRPRGSLSPREVAVPGNLVDVIALAPDQPQTYFGSYNLSLAGLSKEVADIAPPDFSDPVRRIIAHRAADELVTGSVINFGFGMSADVAAIVDKSGKKSEFWVTIEQGLHNGRLMTGALFGIASNPAAIVSSSAQFDLYSGGGLDQTYLGLAEMDVQGNVNVSHIGGRMSGPGGFIDISQAADTVVFCGSFAAKGLRLKASSGQLEIEQHGTIAKLVNKVAGITFSGAQAIQRGQKVIYVTERAVFTLTKEGVELMEIAPGIDLKKDILDYMEFVPLVRNPKSMRADLFTDAPAIDAHLWKAR